MNSPALSLTIPGKPRGQGSLTLWRGPTGKEHAKHSDHTMNHRNLLVGLALEQWRPRSPLEGDVAVSIVASFERPASHFGTGKNRGVLKANAPKRPITRASVDIDKISRLVSDAMDIAGVIMDDSQIVVLRAEKRYGPVAQTVVELWDLG